MTTLPANRNGLRGIEMNDKLLGDIAARVMAERPSQRAFTPGSECR
jgi:hypothetical protein